MSQEPTRAKWIVGGPPESNNGVVELDDGTLVAANWNGENKSLTYQLLRDGKKRSDFHERLAEICIYWARRLHTVSEWKMIVEEIEKIPDGMDLTAMVELIDRHFKVWQEDSKL